MRGGFDAAWKVALPSCEPKLVASPSARQSTDVFLAFQVGRDLATHTTPCKVWLFTEDKALLGLRSLIEDLGHLPLTLEDLEV